MNDTPAQRTIKLQAIAATIDRRIATAGSDDTATNLRAVRAVWSAIVSWHGHRNSARLADALDAALDSHPGSRGRLAAIIDGMTPP